MGRRDEPALGLEDEVFTLESAHGDPNGKLGSKPGGMALVMGQSGPRSTHTWSCSRGPHVTSLGPLEALPPLFGQ